MIELIQEVYREGHLLVVSMPIIMIVGMMAAIIGLGLKEDRN